MLSKSELAARYRRDWRTIRAQLAKLGIALPDNAKTLTMLEVERVVRALGPWPATT